MSINRQPAQPTLSLTSAPTGVDLKVQHDTNAEYKWIGKLLYYIPKKRIAVITTAIPY